METFFLYAKTNKVASDLICTKVMQMLSN